MGVLDGDSAVYMLKIESKYHIRMYSRVGRRMPLYCTAIGKVLLAYMTAEEREAALKGVKLLPMTQNTITSRGTRRRDRPDPRTGLRPGQQPREEACTASVPPSSTTLAPSSPRFPFPGRASRYGRGDEAEKIEQVKAAAARISTTLGFEAQ